MDFFVALLLAMTKGGFPPILFHNATLVGRGLSSGTSPERIAPESVTPMLSGYVHRNISREIAPPNTRSSLARRDKQGFGGEFLKFRGRAESNQKRGRVKPRVGALTLSPCGRGWRLTQ